MEARKMANPPETPSYSTKDLYEAGFLYAAGKELIDLAREGNQAWFIFADPVGCKQLTRLFWAKKGSVAPKVYAEAVRSLKDYLFAER